MTNSTQIVSDTGQLTRNWEHGIYTIDTPRTKAAMGWIGGKKINLSGVDFGIKTRNATISIQSLDNNPLSTASAILLSLGAPSIPLPNGLAFRSEPVVGELTFRGRKGLKMYRRVGDVQFPLPVPFSYANGWYHVSLTPDVGTYWILMK